MITQIYHLFFQELVHYAVGMTGDKSSAEDIVQETFLRALEHADVLNGLDKHQCRAWLYKTARNLFIDRVRREAARPEAGVKEETEDDLSQIEVIAACSEAAGGGTDSVSETVL